MFLLLPLGRSIVIESICMNASPGFTAGPGNDRLLRRSSTPFLFKLLLSIMDMYDVNLCNKNIHIKTKIPCNYGTRPILFVNNYQWTINATQQIIHDQETKFMNNPFMKNNNGQSCSLKNPTWQWISKGRETGYFAHKITVFILVHATKRWSRCDTMMKFKTLAT